MPPFGFQVPKEKEVRIKENCNTDILHVRLVDEAVSASVDESVVDQSSDLHAQDRAKCRAPDPVLIPKVKDWGT